MRRSKQPRQVDVERRALRGNRLARLAWTRALPGSVAVVAALTFPEFSVGAGDLGTGKPDDNRADPASAQRQGLFKRQASAGKEPLAGVRYAALLKIAPAHHSRFALPTAAAARPDRTTNPDAALSVSSQPVEAVSARTPVAPLFGPVSGAAPVIAAAPLMAAAPVSGLPAVRPKIGGPAPLPVEKPLALVSIDLPLAQLPTADAMGRAAMGNAAMTAAPEAKAAPVLQQPSADTGSSAALLPPPEQPALRSSLPASVTGSAAAHERPAFARNVPVSGLADGRTPPGDRDGIAQLAPALTAPSASAIGAPPPQPGRNAASAPQSVPPALAGASAAPTLARAAVPAKPRTAPPAVRPASRPAAPVAAVPVVPAPVVPAPVVAAPVVTAAAVPAAATPPGLGTSSAAPFALAITARLVTRVDGKTAGAVDFQQTATGLKVRLGSIVEVLADRYDPAQIARIQSSAASNVFLSLADLQAQGVPISYDPVYDEFNVGLSDTRPKAARKVHMDQISTPERGLGTTAISQVPRN